MRMCRVQSEPRIVCEYWCNDGTEPPAWVPSTTPTIPGYSGLYYIVKHNTRPVCFVLTEAEFNAVFSI